MDLSKRFGTFYHEILFTKLSTDGFTNEYLRLTESSLTNSWWRTKINNSFSKRTKLLQGVPQGSVLGPLLFSIYLNDFFLVNSAEICNFADYTTSLVCGKDLGSLINRFNHDSFLAVELFRTFTRN